MHWQYCKDRFSQALSNFSAHVLSYEAGFLKPDAEIYLCAIKAAACPPSNCLFIDDNAENVAAAQTVGLHAVQYTGMETSRYLATFL